MEFSTSDYALSESSMIGYDARSRYAQHGSNPSSLYQNDYPSSRAETPVSDYRQHVTHTRTRSETLQLFRNAVDNSRAAATESNAESKASESAVSLNLDLKNQNIGEIQDEVFEAIKRDHGRIIGLILSGNSLRTLPPRLVDLEQLTYLNLKSNHLSEFPRVILSLSSLEVLDVSRNSLSTIPAEIHRMEKLRFLILRNNQLTDLPRTIVSAYSLRIIKLDGNPLNEALWAIVNGNSVQSSPQGPTINENEIAAEVTQQIKDHLKSTSQPDSEINSQSESPLETPRASKRTSLSARFPVKLQNGSSSETGLPPRSPSFVKPAVPARSKQRLFSGSSNGTSQTTRRPGLAPLILGNERNRSQSESIVQATANARNKRMGMMSAKKLDALEEINANRNSLHLRGTSHASALRDRHRIYRSALGSGSSNSISPTDGHTPGIFLRRLSSVPERRSIGMTSRRIVEIARGLVYALHMYDPNLAILISVLGDATPGRASLYAKYSNALAMTKKLDQDLTAFDSQTPTSGKAQRKLAKLIKSACNACVVIYRQVFEEVHASIAALIIRADRRYLRTCMLLLYGAASEIFNATLAAVPTGTSPPEQGPLPVRSAPPRLTIQAANSSRSAVTSPIIDGGRQAYPAPMRRLRSDTLGSTRSGNTIRGPPAPQSAVYARSRSNSRTAHPQSAVSLSVLGNTPRSGEPFLMPGTTTPQSGQDLEQNELERVYASISGTIEKCYTRMSESISQMELRSANYQSRRERDACQRIIGRFQALKNICDIIHRQMVKVKLNDPDTRRFKELCQSFIKYAEEWEMFLKAMSLEKKAVPEIWSAADLQRLRPLHEKHKAGAANARDYLHRPIPTPQQSWHRNGTNGTFSGRQNGHERGGRGDSAGSISSPYIPTTPLSAALGPAAQATIPAIANVAASTGSSFERPFRGNVFERADALLSSGPGLPFAMRNRERGAL